MRCRKKPLFGYKMHLAVDQGSGLVRQAILTPGHISDKAPFLDLVQGDEQAVYADRGYDGAWDRQRLAEQGIADVRRGYRELLEFLDLEPDGRQEFGVSNPNRVARNPRVTQFLAAAAACSRAT